jgi:fumarate reductase subunit C
VSVWWWLQNRSYTGFVLRELTSVFVAFFAVVYLWQLRALAQGPEAYAQFLARLRTPRFLALDTVAFLFVLAHAITWFNLTPKAMVVRLRGKRVPDWVIVGLNYAAWLVLSGAVAFVLLRGR